MNRDKGSLLGLALTGAGLYLTARAIRQYARWYDLRGKVPTCHAMLRKHLRDALLGGCD